MFNIEFLRSFKLIDYAIFDFVASFLGIYLLSPILTKLFSIIKLKVTRKSWLLLTIPVSILVHYLVGNITPMTEDFLNLNAHYFLKGIIILMTYLGIKDIKIIKK